MLTWRYHLLSLVAIFLALGLGVLVGISLTDSGAVETSQAGLMDNIQRDLEDLRNRNDALERDRALNLRFQDDSFPFIVSGRLQAKKIAVVASNKTGDDVLRKLASAVHAAGGQITTTTVLNASLDPAALVGRLKTEMKNDPAYSGADESSAAPLAGAQLTKELSGRGGSPKLLPVLQGVLVDSSSGSYETPVDAVVLITRADDEQAPAYTELEKSLLLGLREMGLAVVGAEPSDAPRSEIPLFQSVDVSSVDNLDSRIGQVSLVYALTGEKGAFGVKATADMLIPILRTPKQPVLAAP